MHPQAATACQLSCLKDWGMGLVGYFSKGMILGCTSCLQTIVKILKCRGNILIFISVTIRNGHPPLDLLLLSLTLVAYEKNPKHREILVLLRHLKNSSLFCVCVEAAGFTKLSYYLPCVTSALHCREQKEQLCYTEFNHLFFSDCRSTEHSVHFRLCLQPSLAAARKKTNLFVKKISYSSGLSSKAATKSMLLANWWSQQYRNPWKYKFIVCGGTINPRSKR